MTFRRRPMLVLQPDTDVERELLERVRTMQRDGRVELEGEWTHAPMFVLGLEDEQ